MAKLGFVVPPQALSESKVVHSKFPVLSVGIFFRKTDKSLLVWRFSKERTEGRKSRKFGSSPGEGHQLFRRDLLCEPATLYFIWGKGDTWAATGPQMVLPLLPLETSELGMLSSEKSSSAWFRCWFSLTHRHATRAASCETRLFCLNRYWLFLFGPTVLVLEKTHLSYY